MKHKNSLLSAAMATIVLVSLVAAASVSVNAADGNSANVQTSGALVGAPAGSAPAVCAGYANSLILFVKGANGDLLYKHSVPSGWTGWTSLGAPSGGITADPAAVWRGSGYVMASVRGGDGSLWTIQSGDGGYSWGGWNEMQQGKLLAGTGPAMYAFPDGRVGWVVTGESHAVWHMWIDTTGTHWWSPLGDGRLSSTPTATSMAQDRLDVFGRGDSGALWWTSYHNGWSGWTSLGGQIYPGTGPAACSWGPNRLDVFATGMSQAMWHWWNNGNGFSGESLHGYLTSTPAATSRSPGSLDVFGVGGGETWYINWISYNNGWSGWTSIGGT